MPSASPISGRFARLPGRSWDVGRSDPGQDVVVRMLWCWRCRAEVPMLEELEWADVEAALERGPDDTSLGQRLQRVQDVYAEYTGVHDENPNAIMHHRASHYGPPCNSCGRPLRTPVASL